MLPNVVGVLPRYTVYRIPYVIEAVVTSDMALQNTLDD